MATLSRQVQQFSSAPLIFLQSDRPLATSIDALLHEHRAYFIDTLHLNGKAPADSLTLGEWSTSACWQDLQQRYGDDVYKQHPDQLREAKPLQSLWAQWYFGLLVPPLMLALILESRALDCSPQHIRLQPHAIGRPAAFWIDVQEDEDARYLNAVQRIDRLVQHTLIPMVDAITRHGDINARLIWNNTGFLMHWFLGELKESIPELTRLALEHALFFNKQLIDGSDNPLYRTVIPRNGTMERRSCCQRYRLPDVQQCNSCTLTAS